MRFRLATAIIVLTSACLALGMANMFGRWGLALALPHIIVLLASAVLWQRKRRLALSAVLAAHASLWLATAAYGPHIVRQDIDRRVRQAYANREFHEAETDYQRKYWEMPVPPAVERPWLYIGSGGAPCPFVVSCDFAYDHGGLDGYGGRTYALVFPGVCWHFGHDFYWMS